MGCKATTQNDGSKLCAECRVSWDRDEKEEDCCPKLRKSGLIIMDEASEISPEMYDRATKDR